MTIFSKAALRGGTALALTFVGLGMAGGASAQVLTPTDTTEEPTNPGDVDTNSNGTEATADAIVVTGSRIARPVNLTAPAPVTVVTAAELASGNVSLGDALNQLPQLRSTFSQANSTRFIGTAGISALDLRGLGVARTLVLVNGRRQITATPGIERVDVNTIPSDLVERVDIVTGGNSAVYGSDAVAGVVNFILNRNFDGLRLTGQGGISDRGDRGSYSASLTAGKNFGDGRGNIAFAAEYAKQNTLYNIDRDDQTGAYSGRSQFNNTEYTGIINNPSLLAGGTTPRPAEPSTGNGIPDQSFLRNVLNNNISEGGLFTAVCPTAAATGETPDAFAARRAVACSGLANPTSSNALSQYGNTFVFQPDSSLIRNPCLTDLRPFSSSNCVGGLGSSLRQTGMLAPGLERYSGTILAHFEISPAFEPFVEARYVNITANQEGQPTFFNNTFSLNNPYLTAQAANTLTSVLAPGATTFNAFRFNVDFGGRGEQHERETYSLVGGVRGSFNDDWSYEVAANYGRLETYYETEGNVLRAQYANSINAVRGPAGNIVCAINADANTANDDPACVPVNLFGQGQVSQAALGYFGYTSSRKQRASLLDFTAYVSGDLSQLFELPGGAVAFVIGGEYREQTAFSAYDAITSDPAGLTFLNSISDFDPPKLIVKELFGELEVPLVNDVPFIEELTLSGAGRYSDYNIGNTGSVFAWNASAIYAPVRDLRFRGSYARSIRAPTQSDLFASASQTFINNFVDPCSQNRINDNPNRAANCAAAGVPTTQTFTVGGVTSTEPFTNIPSSGLSANNGGNPNLSEERGESWTLGLVAEPRFIPGLNITVDYYDITLDNVIFSLVGQEVVNQCYDNPSGINNQYCAAVFRNANGTFAGQSGVTHAGTVVPLTVTGPSALIAPFNFAKQETSGIDADLAYSSDLTDDIGLRLRGLVSYVFKRNNYTDVTTPDYYDRQLSEVGDPQWQGQFSVNFIYDMIDFGYRMRYIGRQVISTEYETQFGVQDRPPENPDSFPRAYYPQITYHDLRLDVRSDDGPTVYFGVDNLFDRLPPFDQLGTEAGSPYSNTGRFFYAGASVRF